MVTWLRVVRYGGNQIGSETYLKQRTGGKLSVRKVDFKVLIRARNARLTLQV
jgi:hypothetical protein